VRQVSTTKTTGKERKKDLCGAFRCRREHVFMHQQNVYEAYSSDHFFLETP